MSNPVSLSDIASLSNEIAKRGKPASWIVIDPEFRDTNLKRGFGKVQIASMAKFLRVQLGAKIYDALWHLDGRRKQCATKK